MINRNSGVVKVGNSQLSKRKKQLPACELGDKCPYQFEYQHGLEYCHTASIKNSQFKQNFGKGIKLGHSTSFDAIVKPISKSISISKPIISVMDYDACPYCEKRILRMNFESHVLVHKDQTIIEDQKRSYEQSVLKDLEKLDSLQNQKLILEERNAFETAIQESMKMVDRIKVLSPEPTGKNTNVKVITIRFCLPSGKKITRNFAVNSSLQKIVDYLNFEGELIGKEWILKTPVGQTIINSSLIYQFDTLTDTGIDINCVLIVTWPTERNTIETSKVINHHEVKLKLKDVDPIGIADLQGRINRNDVIDLT